MGKKKGEAAPNPPPMPQADTFIQIRTLIPPLKEMLDYCAYRAIETGDPGNIGYNAKTDELVYHYRPDSLDTEVISQLLGVEEIWIVTRAGTVES